MQNKSAEISKLIDLFFEVGTLMRMPRMHSQYLSLAKESIAAHSFRVSFITLVLAERIKCDKEKVIKMAILHDVAETRTGDANYVHKFYNSQKEKEAYKEQFKSLTNGKDVVKLLDEYNERKTLEAKLAKDSDLIDQMLLQQEYLYDRPKDLKRWQEHTQKSINTPIAKKLAKKIMNRNPLEWLYKFSESKKK